MVFSVLVDVDSVNAMAVYRPVEQACGTHACKWTGGYTKVCLKNTVSTRPLLRQRCAIIDDYPKCRIMVLPNTKPAKPSISAHIHLLFIMDFGHRNSMT
jgi:hypothetical protein